jgi:hypothetical protein
MLSRLIKRDRAQRFHNFRQFSHFSHLFIALHQSAIARGESNKHDKVELEISPLFAMTIQDIQKRLKKLGNKKHAAISRRFFKTGPGEYGEGDVFIGIRVPVLRKLVKEYSEDFQNAAF